MAESEWENLFDWKRDKYYGYVEDINDALDIIEEFCYATHTSYTSIRQRKNFGTFTLDSGSSAHSVRFVDDGKIKHGSQINLGGVPFMVTGFKLMECHQGPSHSKKKSTSVSRQDSEHSYEAVSRRMTGTKKRGCPAAIYLREVISFPQYKVDHNSCHHRRIMSEKLRQDLESPCYEDMKMDKHIFIDLPDPNIHQGHIMGEAADLKAPIDERVLKHIRHLVDQGVCNVGEMKRHVRIHVKSIFGEKNLPSAINRRFYPSRKDLAKLIYRQQQTALHGLLDQEFLAEKISLWKRERPSDLWFYRPSTETQISVLEEEDCKKTASDTLLLVHQSSWQQKMLLMYGEELVFLDATYRTTRYAVPLFFLCVQTNCGYAVVATFVMEKEDSESLAEALNILSEWNHRWKPSGFMMDNSDIETLAVTKVFPESEIFICDFHRKQAWWRWTSTLKHGVQADQEEILRLLNALAESITVEKYTSRLKSLKASDVWNRHSKLQQYIMREWIDNGMYEKWVWAYRSNYTLIVHTNNGVEAQNKVFKYDYLASYKSKSISVLMNCLVEDFFPDAYRRYVDANILMSKGWREGHKDIPTPLQHRPQHLIHHMQQATMKATDISDSMIVEDSHLRFKVQSATKSNVSYKVFLGDQPNKKIPSCNCMEYCKSHLPCKHMVAVFNHTAYDWESLPEFYKNHPLFCVDNTCVEVQIPTGISTGGHVDTLDEQEDDDSVSATNDEAQPPQPSDEREVSSCAKRLREVLQKIATLSYCSTSLEVLQDAKVAAEAIHTKMLSAAPKSGGLVLEEDNKRKTEVKVKPLPKRRKKKLSLRQTRQLKRLKLSIDGITSHELEGSQIQTSGSAPEKIKKIPSDTDVGGPEKKGKLIQLTSDYYKSLSKKELISLVDDAKKSYKETFDIVSQTAMAVLEEQCPNEDSAMVLHSMLKECKLSLSTGIMFRLHLLLLYELVRRGKLTVQRDFVQEEKERSAAWHELIKTMQVSDSTTKKVKFNLTTTQLPTKTKSQSGKGILKKPGACRNHKPLKEPISNFLDELHSSSTSVVMLPKQGMRYHVCGEVLERRDFCTLMKSNWLNDKIINAFMSLLMAEHNMNDENHIFVMPSYLAVLWNVGRYDAWLYQKVQMSAFEWLFLPVNVNNNHWVLLAVNVPERSISLLDSLNNNDSLGLINKWRKYMRIRSNKVGELGEEWKQGHLTSSRQMDGSSCGLFVLMNAYAAIHGILPTDLTTEHATKMRHYVQVRLLAASKAPPSQRTICDTLDCQKPGVRKPWVSCLVCGRWCHFACVGITDVPVNDYVCPICVARYE